MGTLGQYLHNARVAHGIDLREAAQQTRISIHYLKALEEEDFSKLPGEVFVKGFLKNYGKFLGLDESEVMQLYAEMQAQPAPPAPAAGIPVHAEEAVTEEKIDHFPSSKFPLEPFIWGSGIAILLILFLFVAIPSRRHRREAGPSVVSSPGGSAELASAPILTSKPEKLYLEVVALEDTWLLIRTDNSPQKKALLKKGESLIWSADEQFLLSYGDGSALKVLLNGRELSIDEPKHTVVRDLAITASGVVSRKIQAEEPHLAKPTRKPAVESRPTLSGGGPPQLAKPKRKPPVESQPTQSGGGLPRENLPAPVPEGRVNLPEPPAAPTKTPDQPTQ